MARVNIFWFRRDLRLQDNAGLYHALKSGNPVLPLFIFDQQILSKLEDKADARVEFIHQSIARLKRELKKSGSDLEVRYGTPPDIWQGLIANHEIGEVYTNHDYEPYAIDRDAEISELLKSKGISFSSFKDQVIFEKLEVTKDDGKPYTVFTPYSRKWKAHLQSNSITSYPTEAHFDKFLQFSASEIPTLGSMGFKEAGIKFPLNSVSTDILTQYHEQRNYPGVEGTSKLGVHLRFGTISIRTLARQASELNETYLNELIWRDFYQMILSNFPHVVDRAFKPKYDHIDWLNDEHLFGKWCLGETGYQIVDAGMRELNATGFMHNRVRMVVASFLTKHLLIDWRWGEAYFAQKLLDFDLASNNGGWQWAAGSGCDAAPYFRIFNPSAQTKKFDPELIYIRKWVPEIDSFDYPKPIVEHRFARERALETYKKALSN